MIRLIILGVCLFLIIRYIQSKLPQPQHNSNTNVGEQDPYVILEVTPRSTKEDIKKAYKEKLAANHPDKVSHLSKEIQETAQVRTQEIQRAFDTLMKKHQ